MCKLLKDDLTFDSVDWVRGPGVYVPEYDVSKEALDAFIDMFELMPVYGALFEVPPLFMHICEDGEVISETWYAAFKNNCLLNLTN